MIDEHASSSTTDALAEDTGSNPLGKLEAYFGGGETDQVDNSTTESDDAAGDETKPAPDADAESTDDKKDDPEKEADKSDEDKDKADGKADEEKKTDPDSDDDEAEDFDALNKETPEYLDFGALKAKYPRNVSNDALQEMAKYGEAARKGAEAIDAIGGETFIPGMTTIAQALQTGNPRALFAGIAETASAEDALYVSLVQAPSLAQDENTAAFGTALLSIVDGALQERFGTTMNTERMAKLAAWDSAGWFEKIESWIETGYVEHDDLNTLLETTNNPALLAATNKIKELEGQLGTKDTKAKESTATKQAEAEKLFDKLAADEVGKTLTDIVWKNSTLRDIPSDTAETKAEKAFLRNVLTKDAVATFKESDRAKELINDYKSGKSTTAVFQKKFAEGINQAVLGVRENNAIASGLLAKIYGKSRNTQLANKGNPPDEQTDTNAGVKEPTKTTDFGGERPTADQIKKNLADRIAALPN